jgi:hypothetical protein
MSELLEIDREITGKYAKEQTDRIDLLNRLLALADQHPTPVIIDVLVRALEREVWRLKPDEHSDYLIMLVDALNRFQMSYTRMWIDAPSDDCFSASERAERLEVALADPTFTEEGLIQIVFHQLKGLPFEDLDPRWDVLHARFDTMGPRVQFAMAYAICVNCTMDARHPVFQAAIGLIADAAMNNEDKAKLADALIALRAAQSMNAQLHSA